MVSPAGLHGEAGGHGVGPAMQTPRPHRPAPSVLLLSPAFSPLGFPLSFPPLPCLSSAPSHALSLSVPFSFAFTDASIHSLSQSAFYAFIHSFIHSSICLLFIKILNLLFINQYRTEHTHGSAWQAPSLSPPWQ